MNEETGVTSKGIRLSNLLKDQGNAWSGHNKAQVPQFIAIN